MRKQVLLASGILLTLGSLQAQTVIYSEDFEGGAMPSSYLLYDEDGLTPAATVAQFTSAWIVQDDFSGSNYSAASTSWYSPAGQSNDWMVIPGISIANSGTVLSWMSKAQDPSYPDGYQVYVSTTGTTPSDFSGSPVFSVSADQPSWGEHSVDLSSYAGNTINIAFRNNSNDMFILFVDDIKVQEFSGTDASLTQLNLTRFHEVGSNVNITGQIVNNGATAITAYDVHWSDGTSTFTHSVTGVNIGSAATHNFTHSTPLNVSAAQDFSIDVTIELVNDGNAANDMLSANLTGFENAPDRVIVGEEATGTWCGWCPRGHVWMEYMEEEYEDSWIGIAVHNSDPMTITEYDTWMGSLVGGYPSGIVNRAGEFDPQDFEAAYDLFIDGFSLATVEVEALMDVDRNVQVDVTSMFSTNTSGDDFRYAIVVVEDGVTGTSGDWDQTNYYSFETNDLPLEGAGHDWQEETDPVPAEDMVYNDVARELVNGVLGEAGSVPSTVTTTAEVNYSVDFDLDEDFNEQNIRIVAMLLDENTGEVYNAGEVHLMYTAMVGGDTVYVVGTDSFERFGGVLVPLSADQKVERVALDIYPNPANDVLTLSSPALAEGGNVTIFDMTGKVVYTEVFVGVQSANAKGSVQISVAGLSNGLYNVVLKSGETMVTETISVVH